jgi:FixJ family two-component response regulator
MDRWARRPYSGIKSGKIWLSNTLVISIVDDDESVRTAKSGMVESFGCAVAAFASGAEFLVSDRLHDSACLIADVRMPVMSGFELHDRLIAAGHSIATIFLTAFRTRRVTIEPQPCATSPSQPPCTG